MDNKENFVDLFDNKGNLKTKKEFLGEMEKIYDACQEKNSSFADGFSYLDFLTDAENQVDLKATTKTFNFYNRYFYIDDEIIQDTANNFQKFVSFWNEIEEIDNTPPEETIPLTIYLNSPGGDLDATLSIISTMQSSKIPVNTYVYGRAWSGAFFIAICGKERTAVEFSTFLFHEGSILYGENAHKFIQFTDFYKRQLLETVQALTLSKTKISQSDYERHKNDDWWLTAKDAQSYGIIDVIKKGGTPTNER